VISDGGKAAVGSASSPLAVVPVRGIEAPRRGGEGVALATQLDAQGLAPGADKKVVAFLLIAAATWLSVLVLAVALCRAAAVGDVAAEAGVVPEDTFVAALLTDDEAPQAPVEAPRAPARSRITS